MDVDHTKMITHAHFPFQFHHGAPLCPPVNFCLVGRMKWARAAFRKQDDKYQEIPRWKGPVRASVRVRHPRLGQIGCLKVCWQLYFQL